MRALWLVLLGACVGDIVPEWQLDHDHIVAIRATPPHVPAGATAQLDALVAHMGAMTSVDMPAGAAAIAPPAAFANITVVGLDGTITAPDDATLAQARSELKLGPTDPVPLAIGVTFDGLAAIKSITLGDSGDNPTLGAVTVEGQPVPDTDIAIAPDVDVHFEIDEPDADTVDWLTSCGTLNDDDEHHSFINVAPTDPQSGELAVVVRTPDGGVAFRTWTIHAP